MSRTPTTTEKARAAQAVANQKAVDPTGRTARPGSAAKVRARRNDSTADALSRVGHRLRND